MKALHIAGTIGTILLFRIDLLDKLKDRQVDNWIASNTNKAYDIDEKVTKRGHRFIPSLLRNNGILNYIKTTYKLTLLIRKEKFEFIHTNTPLAGVVGRLAAIFSGSKAKVFHTTGGIPITPETSKLVKTIYFFIERLLAKKTDYIFCPSKIDIEIYNSMGVKPINEIIHCGPAGFDDRIYLIEKKKEFRDSIIEELMIDSETILIGIVARIVAEKGINEFLLIADQILKNTSKKIQFVIVGDGPLLPKVKKQYNNPKITFLGRRHDVPKIMMALDIFLFPSYREGYPVAVVEAMAGQTPVVAFDIDGCKEAIIPNKDGILVSFGDTNELQKAVVQLIDNEKLRLEMGTQARFKVANNCTKKHHITKHLKIYDTYI